MLCIVSSLLLHAFTDNTQAQDVGQATLTVEPRWSTEQFQSGRATIELSLSRALSAPGERLGVMIGTLDVSDVIEVRGQRVRYRPTAVRLPAGESEVVAYVVSAAGEWQEIGRFPLRVRTRTGLDQGRVVPTIDLSSTGQLDQRVADGDPPPERRTYQDLTLRLGFESQMARNGWQVSTQANALGVTKEAQRLRWAEMQGDAPAVDLSDYRFQLERGRTRLTLGNVSAGANRHLLNGFGSRGLSTGFAIGSFAVLDAALLSGTNVVGWDNLVGLGKPDHRIASATLALELLPSRPGAIHIDISGEDGSVLPLASFNQGAVTDAEESRGAGVQVALSDAQQRIRFAGGISRSRYFNPFDPLLSGDASLVPVRPTARTARYADLGLQILRGLKISESIHATLGAALRHERVDPLYRSIGTYVQSDVENNGLELTSSFGPLSLQATAADARDNLAEIASILTTRTRSRGVTGTMQLGSLFGASSAWYLPMLNASWQRVRQFGEGVPPNSDFTPTHVPDQLNTNEMATLGWNRGSASLNYRWNRSFQDNRQTGRERADFRGIVHGLTLSVNPVANLLSSVDLSVERQKNVETGNLQKLERLGGTAQWQIVRNTSISGTLSQSWGHDPSFAQKTRNTEHQLELSQGFTLYRRLDSGTQGRIFLRYARTRAAVHPLDTPSLLSPRITWTLNAGGSLRLY